jgi:pyrimidine-specific ribonucleoside hydrolase
MATQTMRRAATSWGLATSRLGARPLWRVARLLLLLNVIWGLQGCTPTPRPLLRAEPLQLAVDTDMGADDVLALIYLLARPDVELRAVTVSGTGLARCDDGVALARALLAEADRGEVPVACGRETPLGAERSFPPAWREGAKGAYGLPLPLEGAAAPADGPDLLRAAAAGGPLTILALGPLTNLAEALGADPQLAQRIERLVVMGGAVAAPGNLGDSVAGNRTAEWNIYIDPLAADRVLRSGVPVDLVPLDATNALPVTSAFTRRLARDSATPAAALAAQLLEGQLAADMGELDFWDPLAATLAVDEELAPWGEQRIAVVTAEGPESGRTAVDPGGSPVRVAGAPERAAFEQHLLDSLSGRFADQESAP